MNPKERYMKQEVTITITINVDSETFERRELEYDIRSSFPESTGYDIENLEIDKP